MRNVVRDEHVLNNIPSFESCERKRARARERESKREKIEKERKKKVCPSFFDQIMMKRMKYLFLSIRKYFLFVSIHFSTMSSVFSLPFLFLSLPFLFLSPLSLCLLPFPLEDKKVSPEKRISFECLFQTMFFQCSPSSSFSYLFLSSSLSFSLFFLSFSLIPQKYFENFDQHAHKSSYLAEQDCLYFPSPVPTQCLRRQARQLQSKKFRRLGRARFQIEPVGTEFNCTMPPLIR